MNRTQIYTTRTMNPGRAGLDSVVEAVTIDTAVKIVSGVSPRKNKKTGILLLYSVIDDKLLLITGDNFCVRW